jgi:hypothetical protein
MKDMDTSKDLNSGKRRKAKEKRLSQDTFVVQNLHLKDINIDSLIRTIRGQKVMVDFDLAMLYGVRNKRLNEQVKRNIERFPDDFMFQLTKEEWNVLRSQIATAKTPEDEAVALLRSQFATTKDLSKIRTLPYAFTRNGIGMLSSVLGSNTAVAMNIRIMRAFTASQQIMETNAILFKRVFHLEQHQQETDEKINLILTKMDEQSHKLLPEQIFATGCVWDAWTYVSDLLGASVKDMGVGLCAVTKLQVSPEKILEMLK